MQKKDFLIVALAPLPVLMIPLVGMQVSDEWNWDLGSFLFAWVLLAGATFVYRLLATSKGASLAYRAGAGLAVATGFLLTWVNLAVGIIGSEDNPANALYLGVVAVGLTGVDLARFQAQGMALAAFATAITTLLVPVIAFTVWRPDFSPGVAAVFGLNAVFALLFAGSGLLFRHAAHQANASARATTG